MLYFPIFHCKGVPLCEIACDLRADARSALLGRRLISFLINSKTTKFSRSAL